MIQIMIPTVRKDLTMVLESIISNTVLPYKINIIREGDSYARACNMTHVEGDWIMFAADDVYFHPKWDTEAMECYARTGKMVIGTNDMHHPEVIAGRGATHWMVKREYLDTYGGTIDRSFPLMYDYRHNFVDTESVATAQFHKQWAFCSTSLVEHRHPDWGFGVRDEAYERNVETSPDDLETFNSRKHLWTPPIDH